ncbi:DUF5954 family protein [Streptomyces sp. NPDC002851]
MTGDTSQGDDEDAAAFDSEAQQLLADGEREEELRRKYPSDTSRAFEHTSMSHYTAYAAMVLEDKGWRQMFPALPTEDAARHDLSGVLRNLALRSPARQDRYLRAADEIQSYETDQAIIGDAMYRIARIEQTIVMTEYGPEPPKPTDREFPEEFDDRQTNGAHRVTVAPAARQAVRPVFSAGHVSWASRFRRCHD